MVVFEKPGDQNTKETVKLAVQAAREKGLKNIVAASCRGTVADEFIKYADEFNIVIVAQVDGFNPVNPMDEKHLKELREKGLKVLFTTHVLSGAERSISKKFKGVYPVELIAASLRMMGQGTKVCVEISTMALDSRLIPKEEQIIAVGGTGKGADTVVIMTPAHAAEILDTKIDEFICKPKLS